MRRDLVVISPIGLVAATGCMLYPTWEWEVVAPPTPISETHKASGDSHIAPCCGGINDPARRVSFLLCPPGPHARRNFKDSQVVATAILCLTAGVLGFVPYR
jgi:hypothetical protein